MDMVYFPECGPDTRQRQDIDNSEGGPLRR